MGGSICKGYMTRITATATASERGKKKKGEPETAKVISAVGVTVDSRVEEKKGKKK
jgi:hypothetical protein